MTDSADQPTRALPSQPGGQPARTVAGRYRLLEMVGRGGTAEVWRAEDTSLGRTVAVKLVTVPTDEGAQRAGEEARLLARLNHPSLVPVYDAGTDEDDRPWVVMEFVDGETLGDALKRGPLDVRRTAEVGVAVAQALDYVHGQGLVHRDVKPGNVLLGRDGRIRLTDFGIARLVDAAKVTATGMTVGTASYLSPEQVMGERVTPLADVYALGLVLLECLTGRREYQGATVEVAVARLNRQPQVPPTLPAGFPGLLTAMTAREPDARPTAAEVSRDLQQVLSGGQATTVLPVAPPVDRTQVLAQTRVQPAAPATAAVPRPAPAPPLPPPSSSSGAKWAAALVAVVALLVGAAALAGAFRDDTPPPLPPIGEQVPDELREPLQRLQDVVREVQSS